MRPVANVPGGGGVRFFSLLLGGGLKLNEATAAEGEADFTLKVLTFYIMFLPHD